MSNQFIPYLLQGTASLGIKGVSEKTAKRLETYFFELKKWNKKINLVAKADDAKLIETHFLDSLTLLPELQSLSIQSPKLLDVGTGAGFPGLVLKIALPDLPVTLVEPRLKRVSFLKHIIRTLDLTDVEVLAERLEKDDQTFTETHGQYSIVTSRALTEINDFLGLVQQTSAPTGFVICMKGPKAEQEINNWQKLSPQSPFQLSRQERFLLPNTQAERNVIVFLKR